MKVVAILGTYRKGKFTDQIVDAVLSPIYEQGHEVEKIFLMDQHIEFCTNCRKCMNDDPSLRMGECVTKDDMKSILQKMDEADAMILASPMNIFTVTALMKKFIERLVPAIYWPWRKAYFPRLRIKRTGKRALVLTSSAMPQIMLWIIAPGILKIMRDAARFMGYGKIKKKVFGFVGQNGSFTPTKKQVKKAHRLGKMLVNNKCS
ncbi:MAG: flavodoxin family protein [Bacteriovoracaceae bacterium]|nr:flavodoxin family protein [Bacteriovoracaceae bacterium]